MLLMLLMLPIEVSAASFSTMSVEEVSTLLSQAVSGAVSAKDAAAESSHGIALPVALTAEDMITKVYGIVDCAASRDECVAQARRRLGLEPSDDNGALWLETADGYGVDYYGMRPDVAAMAQYAGNKLSDFGFFFLFPYSSETKKCRIGDQAEFCGSLLQEMTDIGLAMDLNTATDDLFEAVGDWKGNFVDVRLLDEKGDGQSGRYILILSVEPNAFTPADEIAAR